MRATDDGEEVLYGRGETDAVSNSVLYRKLNIPQSTPYPLFTRRDCPGTRSSVTVDTFKWGNNTANSRVEFRCHFRSYVGCALLSRLLQSQKLLLIGLLRSTPSYYVSSTGLDVVFVSRTIVYRYSTY